MCNLIAVNIEHEQLINFIFQYLSSWRKSINNINVQKAWKLVCIKKKKMKWKKIFSTKKNFFFEKNNFFQKHFTSHKIYIQTISNSSIHHFWKTIIDLFVQTENKFHTLSIFHEKHEKYFLGVNFREKFLFLVYLNQNRAVASSWCPVMDRSSFLALNTPKHLRSRILSILNENSTGKTILNIVYNSVKNVILSGFSTIFAQIWKKWKKTGLWDQNWV